MAENLQYGSGFTPVRRTKKSALSVNEKVIINNVYNYLRTENPSGSVDDIVAKTSNMTGVSKSTIYKIRSEAKSEVIKSAKKNAGSKKKV